MCTAEDSEAEAEDEHVAKVEHSLEEAAHLRLVEREKG